MFGTKRKNDSLISMRKDFIKTLNLEEKQVNVSNKTVDKINSILKRKDVVSLENEKVDAIRMLSYYLENKEAKISDFLNYLKK